MDLSLLRQPPSHCDDCNAMPGHPTVNTSNSQNLCGAANTADSRKKQVTMSVGNITDIATYLANMWSTTYSQVVVNRV